MPEQRCPPGVTSWCPTPPSPVCCIHEPYVYIYYSHRSCIAYLTYFFPLTQHADTGYVSWRDTQSGSWYVETLDSILEENAATDDLVTMLMMVGLPPQKFQLLYKYKYIYQHILCSCFQVNHEVSQNSAKGLYKQMPGSFNFLRKLLYFQILS